MSPAPVVSTVDDRGARLAKDVARRVDTDGPVRSVLDHHQRSRGGEGRCRRFDIDGCRAGQAGWPGPGPPDGWAGAGRGAGAGRSRRPSAPPGRSSCPGTWSGPGNARPPEARRGRGRARRAGSRRPRARAWRRRAPRWSRAVWTSARDSSGMAPRCVSTARSSGSVSTTVMPVDWPGCRSRAEVSTPAADSSCRIRSPRVSDPVAATSRVDAAQASEPVGEDAAGTTDHEVGTVQQLLDLAEPGNHVTAEDQVGVGITHHQDVGHGRQSARHRATKVHTQADLDDRPCSFQGRLPCCVG